MDTKTRETSPPTFLPNQPGQRKSLLATQELELTVRYPQLKDGWNFKLTPELQSSIDAFTEWYATQHRNRQLSWRPQLGTVTLTARFESGKYEIGVSLFQAIVLLHFNDDNSLDVKEIQARTGIGKLPAIRPGAS